MVRICLPLETTWSYGVLPLAYAAHPVLVHSFLAPHLTASRTASWGGTPQGSWRSGYCTAGPARCRDSAWRCGPQPQPAITLRGQRSTARRGPSSRSPVPGGSTRSLEHCTLWRTSRRAGASTAVIACPYCRQIETTGRTAARRARSALPIAVLPHEQLSAGIAQPRAARPGCAGSGLCFSLGS